MTVYETDLPGVGKKHEIDLGDGSRLVVVTHHSGRRELFRRASADADAEKLLELDDGLARTVGTVLEGAYFQPVATDRVETLLDDDTLLEWVTVGEDSPMAGETLGSADLRHETGATVLAVQRGRETLTNPGSDADLRAGDTVVAVGDRESVRAFRRLVRGE